MVVSSLSPQPRKRTFMRTNGADGDACVIVNDINGAVVDGSGFVADIFFEEQRA